MSPDPDASDKRREAIGGFLSPARHRPDTSTTTAAEATGQREAKNLPGPPGDVDTSAQVASEHDASATSTSGGTEQMTAAEAAGQVAFGSGDASGTTVPIGGGSSSG